MAGETFATFEELQFDEEGAFENFSAELLDERDGGGGRSTSGEQVINEQHAAARTQGIHVHRNGRTAVLEFVRLFVGLIRQLAFFPDRNEPRLKFYSGGGGKNKSPRINAHDCIHFAGFK